jgi:hypothetical protein
MTPDAIQQQIDAIKKANSEARQSPETAKKFLVEAGIIKIEEPPAVNPAGSSVDKKKKQ